MDVSVIRYCLSVLLLTSVGTSAVGDDEEKHPEESREPRVSGRIVKLYSGPKPQPYLCPGEGFQPDPTNCEVFYRCVKEKSGKFTVFRYQCAPGTVYDTDLETCNHPRSTRRSECGGMLKPTAEPSHSMNNNEVDVVQSEVPRPISTKTPIYTEHTTHKPLTTLPWILSTERQNNRNKQQSKSTVYISPSTLTPSKDKITKLTGSTAAYGPWSTTKLEAETTPPKTLQQQHMQNADYCTSDGFMGDSENCRKFYRCVGNQRGGYVKYEFSCSELTVWDDEIQGCNHPWAVKRSKCGRSLSYEDKSAVPKPTTYRSVLTTSTTQEPIINNGGYGYKSNKTIQQQLQISHGSKVTQTQTQISNNDQVIQNQTQIHYGDKMENNKISGLKQNQTQISYGTAVSQTQTQLDYGNKGVQTQVQIDHSKYSSQSQVQIQEVTTTQFTSTEENNNISNNECSESGFMGDSNDCKKFFRCVNNGRGTYTRFEYVCGDGTVWDPEIEACNHAWAVKHCGGKVTSQPATRIPNNTTTSTTTVKSTLSHTYPTETSQSYYTTTKIPDIDDDNNVGYGNQNNQETTSSSTTSMKTTITTVKPTPSTENSNEANTECTSSGFVGDANECKKFYRCVDNGAGRFTKYEFKCGDGTLWDPDIEACNHARAVKLCGEKRPSKPASDSHTTTTTKSTEYHTRPTKTTQIYYTSTHGTDVAGEDDNGYGNQNNEESLSSATTSTTTIKSSSTTSEKSSDTDSECTSSGFVGDASDCKVFYRCVDNGNGAYTKYEFKCGDGTLWDPDIEACNHAWAVKNCGSKPNHVNKEETTTKQESTTAPSNVQTTVTLVQVTNQKPTQNDDYDTGYGNHNIDTSTMVTTTKKSQGQEGHNNSECKSSGFMGDDNDCKKFYRCVDDGNGSYTRYEFTCGEGTVWDSKIAACNHAWAVEKCGGSSSAIENTESNTQSILTTNNGDTSSISTTQTYKDTNKPVTTTTVHIASSSTTSPGTSNKCSNSGFMGDNNDCKKFYRCVDNGDGSYTRYEFTCGEGTVWDSKIEACNHAWAVEKCGGTSESIQHVNQQTTSQQPPMQDEEQNNGYATPSNESSEKPLTSTSTSSSSATAESSGGSGYCTNSGFMSDIHNCKKFYRCVDNGNGGYDRYEFTCGEGTVWDESIEACNHVWAVKNCGSSGTSTTQVHDAATETNSGSEDDHVQLTTEKTTTTTQVYSENELLDGKCEQEGFFGNKNDCKKFYRCVDNGQGGFTKYEFTCGEGTFWNQDIQGCDHISSDRPCGMPSQETNHLNDDMDTQTTSTTKTTTSVNAGENDNVTKYPQSVQSLCDSEGFYANPSDCKKFYRCVANGNGGFTKYDFSCGEGTVWNQEILACDHKSADKTCSVVPSNQTQATSSQFESTTNSYSTTKKQESTANELLESTGSQCASEGFYAHPNDCKKFIRCVSNGNGGYTRYEFSCGDGTVWVQEIQACDHDDDVTSCSAHGGSTSEPENNGDHPSNTSNGSDISSTESFRPNKEDDEYDPGNSKEPSYDETDDCTSEGYFGNKQDCRKFYRCVDNGNGGYTKYDFVCGEGTAWDSDLQTCNHINQVQSCSGSSQEESENGQTTTNKNQAETENSSSTTQATTSTSSSGSTSSNSDSKDKCDSEGYFGDSKDCKKFYRCVDNGKGGFTKYDFTCGDGTIWDQDITNCNHPQDVSNPSCTSEPESGDASSTSSSTTSSSSETTSSTTESGTSSQSTSDCSQESSKKPQDKNITCDKAGYYANPNDCKKFYRCVDWDGDGKRYSVFHFECGEGTIWDPALDTCNHEDSVYPQRDCSQSQSQNVGEETTTTERTTSTTTAKSSTSEQTTTQESTTSEQTTTQQSSTSEQTTSEQTTTEQSTNEQSTTQQSTTSEKTTTQEPTTTEQIVQQTTTSDKTTTQEPTTSEQTTSQPLTTTEKSTTQESTTIAQTTTQQSTTSEKTTTQEPTTSEKTTTQETTTSEHTSTQQSMTSEPATTQESTTSEQTTTQQSTTTTQESTTTEQTTQQTTTSEKTTTTESTTSEQTTTQHSTTTDETTQESTTSEQPTTQQSTTSTSEETSTQQLTTTTEQSNEQTTEQSTTTEQTTEETTDQSTTQTSSTESDSTEGQSTTESSSSDKECPETDDNQYLLVCPTSFKRHPKYCNMFYQCIEDEDTYEAKVAMFKCPNNTIYDENQTQCVTEDKADKKCDGEIANKRRFKRLNSSYKDPIVADRGKYSCSTAGFFSFEKQSECSKGFLKCEKSKNGQLRGLVYLCPDGYIYWSISKRCERIETVRDCKRSFNDWTGRWNIPVERKNIATK